MKKSRIRGLTTEELEAVAGGTNPHLVTQTVTTNPGGVVNNSVDSNNPNLVTQSIVFKTTGKPT